MAQAIILLGVSILWVVTLTILRLMKVIGLSADLGRQYIIAYLFGAIGGLWLLSISSDTPGRVVSGMIVFLNAVGVFVWMVNTYNLLRRSDSLLDREEHGYEEEG
jgi:hypothetical protein